MKSVGYWLVLMALSLWTVPAAADCDTERGYNPPSARIDFGQILVTGNDAPGTVLETVRTRLPEQSGALRCDRGFFGVFRQGGTQAALNRPPVAGSAEGVYESGVHGVGIRLRLQPMTNPRGLFAYEPVTNASFSSRFAGLFGGTESVTRPAYTVVAEAVRTAGAMSAGRFTGGEFARLATDSGDRILTVSADGAVVGSTCEVAGPRDITVVLPSVALSLFGGVGSTAGTTPFSINLRCSGVADARNRVAISLDYDAAQGLAGQGVITNAAAGNAAQGIGVQVLGADGVPAALQTPIGDQPLVNGQSQPGIGLQARYYQTRAAPTAGSVQATARFTIVYP